MTEEEILERLDQWRDSWGDDLPSDVRSTMVELRRILIEINCPILEAKARKDLEATCKRNLELFT